MTMNNTNVLLYGIVCILVIFNSIPVVYTYPLYSILFTSRWDTDHDENPCATNKADIFPCNAYTGLEEGDSDVITTVTCTLNRGEIVDNFYLYVDGVYKNIQRIADGESPVLVTPMPSSTHLQSCLLSTINYGDCENLYKPLDNKIMYMRRWSNTHTHSIECYNGGMVVATTSVTIRNL